MLAADVRNNEGSQRVAGPFPTLNNVGAFRWSSLVAPSTILWRRFEMTEGRCQSPISPALSMTMNGRVSKPRSWFGGGNFALTDASALTLKPFCILESDASYARSSHGSVTGVLVNPGWCLDWGRTCLDFSEPRHTCVLPVRCRNKCLQPRLEFRFPFSCVGSHYGILELRHRQPSMLCFGRGSISG